MLTPLSGIDVGVASAILFFTSPTRDIAMGEPEWASLVAFGRLDRPYPAAPSPADYSEFRQACLAIGDELGVDLVTLQRGLWQHGVATAQLQPE